MKYNISFDIYIKKFKITNARTLELLSQSIGKCREVEKPFKQYLLRDLNYL